MYQYSGKFKNTFSTDDWKFWFWRAEQETARVEDLNKASGGNFSTVQKELLSEDSYKHDAVEEWKTLNFWQILRNLPSRIYNMWNIYYMTVMSGKFLRIAQLYFTVVAFFVLLGIYLRRRTLKQDYLLFLPAIYITIIHLVFHAEARYTLPARAFLLVFAGVSAVWVYKTTFQKFNFVRTIKARFLK